MLHKLRSATVRPRSNSLGYRGRRNFIGAKKSGKRGRGAADKVIVAGAVEVLARRERKERVGPLRLQVVADGSALVGVVVNNVEIGSIEKCGHTCSFLMAIKPDRKELTSLLYHGFGIQGYRTVCFGVIPTYDHSGCC
ncbi:MAG: hypothetical protein LWW97_10975 [Deltaproteobacteria bacterium]|nr:hypothetical protein [Deltaproteobacteria bacterium]